MQTDSDIRTSFFFPDNF